METDSYCSELLDQSIKIFDRDTCYRSEKGRVTFLKSVVLKRQDQNENSKVCLQQARPLLEVVNKTGAATANLTLKDFDRSVHVWGR